LQLSGIGPVEASTLGAILPVTIAMNTTKTPTTNVERIVFS